MDKPVQKVTNSFSRELRRRVRDYLNDREHKEEFENWYLQKYGKAYQWKKGSDIDCKENLKSC